MKTEMGEYIVGAYLQHLEHCDFVAYNVRPPTHGLEGLGEMDVVGMRFRDKTAFICEVTTHLEGLQYGTSANTISRIQHKFRRQKNYAQRHLNNFDTLRYMFWSPIVRSVQVKEALATLQTAGLELVIDDAYTKNFHKLEEEARKITKDTGNPVFRLLQIEAHLRPIREEEAVPPVRTQPRQTTGTGFAALIQLKRESPTRSWVQLRKGCLDLLGREVTHSTRNFGNTSCSFARKAQRISGLTYEAILAWLDEKGYGHGR